MILTRSRTFTHESGALVTVERSHRLDGLRLAGIGLVLITVGMAFPGPEMPAGEAVDVTPSPTTPVYVDDSLSDAEAEGVSRDVFTVTASDGTTTENHIRPDDTVWGIVTLPDGSSFTFGVEEDDPEWNCQTMGNRECGGN